jgi:NitT/TauT family transport system substrate-binding protein
VSPSIDRRNVLRGGLATAAMGLAGCRRRAGGRGGQIRFLTSWFAQAEHGGFYQAQATGLYAHAGIDVAIAMGGPQVNGLQLLAAGAADIIMGYDIQVLKAVEQGLPVVTIAACFQQDQQGLMTHADITDLAQLRDHKVLLATPSHATFWPWLQQRYGFRDDQIMPYTYNLQPFLRDPRMAVQAFPSAEPYEAQQQGARVRFFALADQGYPPYGATLVTTRAFLARRPEAVAAFLRASMLGWRDYLARPAPGNGLIRAANPQMTQDRLDYAVRHLNQSHVLDAGLAPGQGVGSMTQERWRRTRDFLVAGHMLSPATDWQRAFTTQFTHHAGLKQA